MRLLLVRHGESVCITKGIVGGEKGCTGLSELGHAQARALGERFAREGFVPDVILSSTLPRAVHTAEAVSSAVGVPFTLDAELKEFIPGAIDGTPWSSFEGFDVNAEPDRALSEGGESLNAFRARVRSLLDRLANRHEGATVVAVCHGGVIGASLAHGFAVERLLEVEIDFTSITEWKWDGSRWHLARFNDHAHLLGTELLV